MCWNQYVSLNTFMFSIFVLLLIAYNNKYTQYKTPFFYNKFVYFFFLSFITMQLIEFFIWRNIDDAKLNNLFSILGALLLIIQPIASLLMLEDNSLKYTLITLYSIVAFPFFIYQNYYHKMTTVVSKYGHLLWKWNNQLTGYNKIIYLLWFVLLYFSLIVNKSYIGLIYVTILLAITYYSFLQDGSAGSLWCWSINSVMIYYAIKLLIWLPFKEHGLC
jgi:hypothetical protein